MTDAAEVLKHTSTRRGHAFIPGAQRWWCAVCGGRDDQHGHQEPSDSNATTATDVHARLLAEQAIDLVYGDRNVAYGHPYDDYSRTAALWSALLGHEITAHQAALMMVLVKLSREMNQHKDDNIVDSHGYLMVASRILERMEDATS